MRPSLSLFCFAFALLSCTSSSPATIKSARGGVLAPPPVFQNSWNQPTWFVDPANVTGCANDPNATCGSATCIVGDGPCKTYAGIAAKWQTYAPRLRQNTTITWLSSQSDDSDPVVFTGFLEHGSSLILQGTLGTAQQTGTGTLAGVVHKSTATPQLLNATLGAGPTTNQLVVNTTHPSAAWSYLLTAGTTFSLTQPLGPVSPLGAQTEVDTWANTDAFKVYAPVNVDLVDIEPQWIDQQSGGIAIFELTAWTARGPDSDPLIVGDAVTFVDTQILRQVTWRPSNGGNPHGYTSCASRGAISETTGSNFFISGGDFTNPTGFTLTFPIVNNDTILAAGSTAMQMLGAFFPTNVYLESGNNLFVGAGGTGSGQTGVLYGAGTIDIFGAQVWGYSGTATAAFPQATLQLNQLGSACSYTLASPSVWNCNITITKAHLDAAAGAAGFGGVAVVPGGATYSQTFF